MKFKEIFLIAAIILGIAQYMEFILTPYWIIALLFLLWFVLTYISIHNKNKERNTPKPVYMANPHNQ